MLPSSAGRAASGVSPPPTVGRPCRPANQETGCGCELDQSFSHAMRTLPHAVSASNSSPAVVSVRPQMRRWWVLRPVPHLSHGEPGSEAI